MKNCPCGGCNEERVRLFNQGIEAAAKFVAHHVFETKDHKGQVHTWQIGKELAKQLRKKKRSRKELRG